MAEPSSRSSALSPYLTVKDAAAAIEFYRAAFGAVEQFRLTGPDGRIGHAELRIGGCDGDAVGRVAGLRGAEPATIGGSPVKLHLYVDDCDAVVARAVAAGATLMRPVVDQFYGDRSGMVADPFGHSWFVATLKEQVAPRRCSVAGTRRCGGRSRLSRLRPPRDAVRCRRAAHRAGGPGLRRGRPDRAGRAARPAPADRAAGAAADRLGQRGRPLALPAAVLAARPLPARALDGFAYAGRRRRLFEYWGHEASLLPVQLQPLLRWRMERARAGRGIYGGSPVRARAGAASSRRCWRRSRARGPLAAGELARAAAGEGGWWGWSDGKLALEFLFWAGLVTTAHAPRLRAGLRPARAGAAARRAAAPTPSRAGGAARAAAQAARALGVATARDLRDYFRLDAADVPARHRRAGRGRRAAAGHGRGLAQPAWLDPAARLPRRVDARALLSPFDSLVWERARTERLFGFRYRLEIYTPAHKRMHGYYVLPFLLGDRLVARVDLRSDRQAGCLRVLATHLEPGVDRAASCGPLRRGAAPAGRLARAGAGRQDPPRNGAALIDLFTDMHATLHARQFPANADAEALQCDKVSGRPRSIGEVADGRLRQHWPGRAAAARARPRACRRSGSPS